MPFWRTRARAPRNWEAAAYSTTKRLPRRRGSRCSIKLLSAVFQESAQTVAAAGMAEFAQGLGFNLADALAGDREVLPHPLQRVLTAVFQAEAHLDDLLFARRERLQHLRGLLPQVEVDHRLGGRNARLVHDEIAEVGFLFLPDGSFQRDRLLRHPQHLADLRDRQLHLLGK